MNIASRVEAYCRTLNASVLIIGEFLEALLAEGSRELAKAFVDEGLHALRGRKEPVRLFSLRRSHAIRRVGRTRWSLKSSGA